MYLDSQETAHAYPCEAGGIVTVALLHLHEGPGRSVAHDPFHTVPPVYIV